MEPSAPQPSIEKIVEVLSQPLLRYLQRYTGERSVADDLLQETLIRIARGLPAFVGRATVRTWAFSIASRVAADHFRSPDRRRSIVEVDEAVDVPDPDRSIDERIVVDEMNACVRQVIDSLPAHYRAALVLHDLEGLSAGEVAEISGCTPAAVKVRIHRARLRLREALQRECEFYRDGDTVLRCDRKPE